MNALSAHQLADLGQALGNQSMGQRLGAHCFSYSLILLFDAEDGLWGRGPERRRSRARRLDQPHRLVDILLGGKTAQAQANGPPGRTRIVPQGQQHVGRGVVRRIAGRRGRKCNRYA
ncbi:hypothetical protein D3C84_871210 [compost metagenome]